MVNTQGGRCSGDLPAKVTPASRLLLAPLRRRSETVPDVVGVQDRSTGWPAVTLKPLGTLGGLAVLWARASSGALRRATKAEREKSMAAVLYVAKVL